MTIYIKDMVCVRCKMAVQSVLESLQISYLSIQLGQVKLAEALSPEQQKKLNKALQHYELELIDDAKKILIERIKVLIIEKLHYPANDSIEKLSVYLSKHLNHDYTYLANVFSEMQGCTIEKYYIESRVERVKELIVYDDLTITEIAYKMNYSSVAHLSLQFKKVTGQTPSTFKKLCQTEDFIWRTCE